MVKPLNAFKHRHSERANEAGQGSAKTASSQSGSSNVARRTLTRRPV